MAFNQLTSERLSELCAGDKEFMMLARYWNGGLRLGIGETVLALTMAGGRPSAGANEGAECFSLSGEGDVWEKVLAPVPPRGYNDAFIAMASGLACWSSGSTIRRYSAWCSCFARICTEQLPNQ